MALVRRRFRHDAGDDVRRAGLSGRRRHDAGHRATDALGQPDPDRTGDRLLLRTFLPQCLARPEAASRRHGRAGGTGCRCGLRRQRLGHAERGRRGVFRFGHHVCLLPALGPLSGNDGAAEGGAQRGDPGPRHSGLRHASRRMAVCQFGCGRRTGSRGRVACRGRGPDQARRDGAGRWLRTRRRERRGRVPADRREPPGAQTGRRCADRRQREYRQPPGDARRTCRRGDAGGSHPAPDGACRGRKAAPGGDGGPRRRTFHRSPSVAGSSDGIGLVVDRCRARPVDFCRCAGGELSLRAVAGDTGGIDGGDRGTGRARRAGDARPCDRGPGTG